MSTTPFWRQNIVPIAVGLGNVFLIGAGMGVPVFAVLYGLPVGWWLGTRLATGPDVQAALRSLVLSGAGLAGASLLVLTFVWGPHVHLAFDPQVDAVAFGIPLILYGSQASMAAWFVLMLVIAPLGQFALVVTAGVLAMLRRTD